jgi:hypothetical protein
VDIESIDIGNSLVHLEGINTPKGLTLSNITCIQILFDLILAGAELHSGAIMALVDVFVDVLDGLDRCDPLDIDVAAVLPDEIRRIRNHPTVVYLLSSNLKGPSSITTTENGIGILRK